MTTVGITGHMGLTPELRREVAAGIAQVLASVEGPITGYTSLAAGTDQTFAWAVLAAGGNLVFLSPCQRIEETIPPEDLTAFRTLRALAVKGPPPAYDEPSEEAFWTAGRQIADEVDLLVAAWDGEVSRGLGGTADVWYHRGDRAKVNIWPEGKKRP